MNRNNKNLIQEYLPTPLYVNYPSRSGKIDEFETSKINSAIRCSIEDYEGFRRDGRRRRRRLQRHEQIK
jgi:hypothetical protein